MLTTYADKTVGNATFLITEKTQKDVKYGVEYSYLSIVHGISSISNLTEKQKNVCCYITLEQMVCYL